MTCNDWLDSPGYDRGRSEGFEQRNRLTLENMQLTNRASMLRAMLCAALTVLDRLNVRDLIDYDEAGVTKEQFDAWWAEHKAEDEFAAARKVALDKAKDLLTPEELALLRLTK